MKVTAAEIVQAFNVVDKLIAEKRPLPTKGKYRLTRLFSALQKETQAIEMQRNELVTKFSVEEINVDAEGKQTTPKPRQVQGDQLLPFYEEYMKVMIEEVEVACEPIPLAQLDAPALVEVDGKMIQPITTDELLALEPFIDGDA